MKTPSTETMQELEQIAKEHLVVDTLETRKRDSLDFYDVSVWGIEAALIAAYRLGQKNGEGK